jgi:uncharacterized protein YqeY
VSILAALNAKTLELRKTRDPLAGSFQAVQALATANAKETVVKLKQDPASAVVTDEDALRAIQKSIKQVNDTLALKPDHEQSIRELAMLESLLPQMASEDDIRGEAETFAATLPEKTMKQMGAIMAHLSTTFGTSLDKAKASAVVRQVLAA